MFKFNKYISLVLVLIMLLVLSVGCSSDGANGEENGKEVTKLNFHHFEASGNAVDVFLNEWADKVEAESEGTVEITIFPGASLGAPNTAVDMLNTGVCDIAWTFSGFHPGRFPLSDGISLPMIGLDTAKEGTTVLNEMYYNTEYLKDEFDDFKVICMSTNSQNPIVTKDIKVEKMEDLKNLQIRVPGGPPTDFAIELGYSPIGMSPGDIFSSIEKNVIKGYVIDWGGIENFKLYEVSNYYLSFPHYEMPFYCLMNKDVYNSLPEVAQKAIDNNSGIDTALKIATAFDDMYEESIIPAIEKNGSEIVYLSDAEMVKFKAKALLVWDKWIEETNAKDLPAQEVVDKYLELIENYSE